MIIEKIILGLTLAIPLGPISLAMIRSGLQKGFWAAFVIRLGGITGHLIILFASYMFLHTLHEKISYMLALGGAILMIITAISGLNSQVKIAKQMHINEVGFAQGFVLAFANPVSVIFWLGVFAASLATSNVGFAVNLFILLGVLLWGVVLSAILHISKDVLQTTILKKAVIFANLLMLCYGLYYLAKCMVFFSKLT